MKSALIGHTGFVGSNLKDQFQFTSLYNSKNIKDIQGQSFDLLACSGARAEKWKANQDPKTDLEQIESLISNLKEVIAKKAVLISTIDVYPNPQNVDENSNKFEPNHAYGLHRRKLEEFFISKFDTLTVRLPGLFGKGLKKNVIYDFLNNNQVEKIDSRGVFQFYDLKWLWSDIQKALENKIKVLNLATEPISVSEVAKAVLDKDFHQETVPTPAKYDFHSIHSKLWSAPNHYLYSKPQVLNALKQFAKASK